jgi:hypothetical protein
VFRHELLLDGIDVAQNPKLGNRSTIDREEGRSAPLDIAAGCFNAEQFCTMRAAKAHSRRNAMLRRYQLLDGAPEISERQVQRSQVADEPVWSAQLGAQRGAEAEIRVENLARSSFIRLIPHNAIKALNDILGRRRQMITPAGFPAAQR